MNLPNKLTMLRIVMIPVFVILALIPAQWAQYVALLVYILACITDTLDGRIARSHHMVTNFGKFADPIADKLLVMSALVILVDSGRMPAWWCIVMLSREFIISGFRLVAAGGGKVIAAGKLGKIKTTTQIIAIILLLVDNFPFCYIGFPVHRIMEWVAVFFTIWSGADYIVRNRAVLMDKE